MTRFMRVVVCLCSCLCVFNINKGRSEQKVSSKTPKVSEWRNLLQHLGAYNLCVACLHGVKVMRCSLRPSALLAFTPSCATIEQRWIDRGKRLGDKVFQIQVVSVPHRSGNALSGHLWRSEHLVMWSFNMSEGFLSISEWSCILWMWLCAVRSV